MDVPVLQRGGDQPAGAADNEIGQGSPEPGAVDPPGRVGRDRQCPGRPVKVAFTQVMKSSMSVFMSVAERAWAVEARRLPGLAMLAGNSSVPGTFASSRRDGGVHRLHHHPWAAGVAAHAGLGLAVVALASAAR